MLCHSGLFFCSQKIAFLLFFHFLRSSVIHGGSVVFFCLIIFFSVEVFPFSRMACKQAVFSVVVHAFMTSSHDCAASQTNFFSSFVINAKIFVFFNRVVRDPVRAEQAKDSPVVRLYSFRRFYRIRRPTINHIPGC